MKKIIFNKLLINDKKELSKHKIKILELFKICFNKEFDDKLWQWAYIDNPNGNPIVSLYFDGEKLVGHYAVIPMNFLNKSTLIKGLLAMTAMVHPDYRLNSIFVNQAKEVDDIANELNYKFIYAFPNKNSAPGFKKRLNWILEEDLYVANFSYNELQQIEKRSYLNAISFNTQDKANIEWRLSKPNQNYFKKNNNILKEFEGNFDIVFNGFDFSNLDRDKKYNLLLDHSLDKHLDKKEFDYIFGYRLFDTSLEGVEFKKDLLMSDVF